MPSRDPSQRLLDTLIPTETPNVLSRSLAALVMGALSQAEATKDLTNRVCDRYIGFQARQSLNRTPSSGT